MIVVDNLFGGEALEEAERVRDPSHVRSYTDAEWRISSRTPASRSTRCGSPRCAIALEPWLERAGCTGADASRVASSSPTGSSDGHITLDRIAMKAVK